jgi:ABC-type branched-subunit amino acid transport system ATPase component
VTGEPTMGAALQARDIDFSYGQLQVLFGVSIDVSPGEALALLGTNGAGKSTLLKVIAGLDRASRGQVQFDGQDITEEAAERLPGRGLLLVVGGRSVFTDMTVEENLEMQALTARLRPAELRERLDAVFATFPVLADRRRQRAGTLSGGEQQQVALAKALLLDPKLLCIDELSLGLAPVVVGELIEVVRRIKAAGVSLIVVEQSLNIAAEICERSVFLEKGEVRFEGPTRELLDRDDIARAVFLGASDPAAAAPAKPLRRSSRRQPLANRTTGRAPAPQDVAEVEK